MDVHRHAIAVHANGAHGIGEGRAGMGINKVAKNAADQRFTRLRHIGIYGM
ncbi:hypothetical protein GCM10027021_03870 [Dyella kyungheensis]